MNGVSLAVDEKSPELGNFTYETDFSVSKSDGRIGLLFRYISDNEWGAVCYDNGGWVWKNGAGEYGSFGGSSVHLEGGKTYKLKLKVQDNNLSLWIDGELVGSQAIPNLPNKPGKIGLQGWFGNKDVTLSNLKVEEILPLLPPEVGETEEQVIKSEQMKVVLDNNFPRVIRYEWNDGSTLVGEDEQLYIMEINGEKYVPEVTCKTENNETIYTLEIKDLGVKITLKMTVDKNKLRMEVTNIEESKTKVKTINFPNHSLASVTSKENGQTASVLTTGDWNNIKESFEAVKDLSESSLGKTYAFINNDEFAVTINNNVIEGGNRINLSTENRDGYKKTGIGNGTWTYREELTMPEGYKVEEELPWSEVMITKDANKDNKVDWQDAAIQYRKNMKIPRGGEDIKNNMSYIAMNIGYTQNPFLRSLDMVKKISNYTDNFGQMFLHKGYQAEGHDDSIPDYGGHIGIRQGGIKDFNTLINESKKYNTKVGVHINATEYTLDAFEYPEGKDIVNEKAQGWTWVDRSFYADQRKDITSGELFRRLDMLKADAPDLGWVYVDVYTGNGWNAHRLADKIDSLGFPLATEMNGPLEQDAIWTHWGGDPAYPNKGNASQIMRFMKNHVQDTFLANPLLKGNKHLLSGGWGTRHSVEGEYGTEVFYNQVLPTKYLQHFAITKMDDKEVLFENGVKSADEGNNINFYKDGRIVATTPKNTIGETGIGKTKLFLPWNPVEEDEKIYHWNPLGTKSDWELPESWKDKDTVELYELTDLGRKHVKEIKVKNGKVTLDVKKDTPYLVLPGKVKEERINDWGYGSQIKDPGFDSQTWNTWKKTSSAKNTDHIKIINENTARREGNDLVEITGKDAKLTQSIDGLEPGTTYSVSAWVKNDDNRDVTLKVKSGSEKVENKITKGSLVRAGEASKFYGDTFTRMEVEFTVPGGLTKADISLEVGEGSRNSKVFVDDFRIWEHPGKTNKDGYVFYEDFENVDEGVTPFYLAQDRGMSNRTHLTEKSLDENKQKRMNWVLDGRFSLKSNQNPDEKGEILTTEEATFKLEKNKTYELGFIYSLADAKQGYTVNIKSKSQGTLLSIDLDATNVDTANGKFTNAKEVAKEFTTGNTDDYYLTLDKKAASGDIVELIIDNIYIKEINKTIKKPKLQYVNLNTMINNLEVGKSIDIFANALMNNGETVNLKDAKVEYISSNKKVATVENGKLIAKSKGSTKISLKVTVDKKTVTSNEITINVSNK